jgi:hypothetical protein
MCDELTRILEAAQEAAAEFPPEVVRVIVEAAMTTLDDLIIEARLDGNEEWPDEGDLPLLFAP